MKRVGFTMKLKPGYEEEYKKRHDEIWPELKKLLTKSGISDYSIFLDSEKETLFAYHLVTDDFDSGELVKDPLIWKWWEYMADLMVTNDDNSPFSAPLDEVFHMD